jgi:hypothetical protein
LQSANKTAHVRNIKDVKRKYWPENVSSDFDTVGHTYIEGHTDRQMEKQKDGQMD